MVSIHRIFCCRLMKGFCDTALQPKSTTAMPTINPISGKLISFAVLINVPFQYPVRQIPVADQLNGASIFLT